MFDVKGSLRFIVFVYLTLELSQFFCLALIAQISATHTVHVDVL